LQHALVDKKRKFVETIDLQIALKNYDPAKDTRFSGQFVLPFPCRKNMRICVIGNQHHCDEAQAKEVDFINVDGIKAFDRDNKQIKKWAKPFDAFISSDSLIRQVPRLLGPYLNKVGKFPTPISDDKPLDEKIEEVRRTVKFQMKRVLCLGVAVGTVELTEDQIVQNVVVAVNGLVSLLKKKRLAKREKSSPKEYYGTCSSYLLSKEIILKYNFLLFNNHY